MFFTFNLSTTAQSNSCLGEAASFGLLGLENGNFTVNSGTNLTANVGYSRGVVSGINQKVKNFIGTAYVHSEVGSFVYASSSYNPSGGVLQNISTVDAKLNQANTDAIAASADYANYPVDVNLGNVTTNQVVNRAGNITVVSISSMNYNSNTIQLIGVAGNDDAFIINVAGNFDFSQSTVFLTNVRPERVVWNFPNASNIVVNKSSNVFRGTILAPIGSVIYHNPASFEGAIIAKNISVHSAFNLTQRSLDIPCEDGGIRRGNQNSGNNFSNKTNFFNVAVMSSNPSFKDFTLQITGKSTEPIRIRILDIIGREINTTSYDGNTTLIRLGENLKAGNYFAEVIKGTNRKVLKLVKQN
jgi:hypothetical protein